MKEKKRFAVWVPDHGSTFEDARVWEGNAWDDEGDAVEAVVDDRQSDWEFYEGTMEVAACPVDEAGAATGPPALYEVHVDYQPVFNAYPLEKAP